MQHLLGLVLEPQDDDRAAGGDGWQRLTRLARVVTDGVTVRAGVNVADHLQHLGLEPRRDRMLHGVGLLVDVVPRDPHHLDQIGLDQPVPRHDPLRHLATTVAEVDQLVVVAADQPVVGHAPQHLAR